MNLLSTESDSMATIEVPDDVYRGAQTACSLTHYQNWRESNSTRPNSGNWDLEEDRRSRKSGSGKASEREVGSYPCGRGRGYRW